MRSLCVASHANKQVHRLVLLCRSSRVTDLPCTGRLITLVPGRLRVTSLPVSSGAHPAQGRPAQLPITFPLVFLCMISFHTFSILHSPPLQYHRHSADRSCWLERTFFFSSGKIKVECKFGMMISASRGIRNKSDRAFLHPRVGIGSVFSGEHLLVVIL